MAATMNLLSSSRCLRGPQRPVFGCRSRSSPHVVYRTTCQAASSSRTDAADASDLSRRAVLLGLTAIPLGFAVRGGRPALAKNTAQVGDYLPKSDIEGFSLFVPDRSKTPVSEPCTSSDSTPISWGCDLRCAMRHL